MFPSGMPNGGAHSHKQSPLAGSAVSRQAVNACKPVHAAVAERRLRSVPCRASSAAADKAVRRKSERSLKRRKLARQPRPDDTGVPDVAEPVPEEVEEIDAEVVELLDEDGSAYFEVTLCVLVFV